MARHTHFLIAIGLTLASWSAAVLAQTTDVRGLDFRTYLSLQRGMTEGQVLSVAGKPDVLADQGVMISDQSSTNEVRGPDGNLVRGPGRTALAVKTYTYLPTAADPYTTTITLVGGRVTDIQRDRKF